MYVHWAHFLGREKVPNESCSSKCCISDYFLIFSHICDISTPFLTMWFSHIMFCMQTIAKKSAGYIFKGMFIISQMCRTSLKWWDICLGQNQHLNPLFLQAAPSSALAYHRQGQRKRGDCEILNLNVSFALSKQHRITKIPLNMKPSVG